MEKLYPPPYNDSFYSALVLYNKTYKFYSHEVKDWFDIGHAQLYFKTRMQVKARLFNHIEIDNERGILKKTSRDVEKFIGEIKWYLKLPVDLEYVRPRIFDYSLHYGQPYVRMEYYSYRTLHELFVYGELTSLQWKKIFSRIKFVLEDFSRYKLDSADLKNSLRSMYLDKTLNRLNKLKEPAAFSNFFKEPLRINGTCYQPLDAIIKILENVIPKFLLEAKSFSIIHGDFCFPNIMIDDNFNFIKLIDPRGKFGDYDIYGDPRYEFAKLLHSIEGKYDFIIKDLFDLKITGENDFNLKILDAKNTSNLNEIFFEVFNDDLKKDIREIRLIEALLFFSMIPMHQENFNRQLAMMYTGIKILNELIPVEI